jgi:hypothetical protein
MFQSAEALSIHMTVQYKVNKQHLVLVELYDTSFNGVLGKNKQKNNKNKTLRGSTKKLRRRLLQFFCKMMELDLRYRNLRRSTCNGVRFYGIVQQVSRRLLHSEM